MILATSSTGERERLRRSHRRQTVWSARATCWSVISGFFPPKPVGPLGDEGHDELAEDRMSHQPDVTASLEVRESDLGLDHAEDVLDVGAGEGYVQQRLEGGARRGVGEEILDRAGDGVLGDDEPEGTIGGIPAPREVYGSGFDEPA